MPQHELLACAQCGCFAFSCFEDFAIRANSPSGNSRAIQHWTPSTAYFNAQDTSMTDVAAEEPVRVKPDNMQFDELMLKIRNGQIRIPDFQRGIRLGT